MRSGIVPIAVAALVLGGGRGIEASDELAPEAVVQVSGDALEARAEETPSFLGHVATLRIRGGRAAMDELATLLAATPEAGARRAVLEALRDVGLRSESVTAAVREATASRDVGERAAALRALGRVGTGNEVPLLLEALQAENGADRTAALRALGDLAGGCLPASGRRCAQWWDTAERRSRAALADALEGMADAVGEHRTAASHRATVARDGWVDVARVERAARGWLVSPDHRLRAEALHAIAVLRLADVADAVEAALPFVNEQDVEEGRLAAQVLGLSVEAIPRTLRGDT